MNSDIERWNKRYAASDGVVEPSAEPEWLAQPVDSVFRKMRARSAAVGLDLACGKGSAALYLATLGYRMLAVDCAIEGLRICQEKAKMLSLPVCPVVMDLDRATLPKARFDVVSVVRFLNRDLYQTLIDSLAPGGTLFYKTFNTNHLKIKPGFNPDFVLQPGELTAAFSPLSVLTVDESGTSSYIIAVKSA